MKTRLSLVLCVLCSSFAVVRAGDEKPLTWADFHVGLSRTRQPLPWTSQPFGHKTAAQGMRFGQRFPLSYDEGESWSQTVYELYHGGLYDNSVVLDDVTIVTVHDNHDAGQRHLNVLRWKLPSRSEVSRGGFFQPRPVKEANGGDAPVGGSTSSPVR